MTKPTHYKTTAEAFQYFQARCEYWIGLLGLGDWDIDYAHEKSEHGKYMASVVSRGESSTAKIFLHTDWTIAKPTPEQLDETALHEVLHVLFYTMMHAAFRDDFTPDQREKIADQQEHKLINRLVKLIPQIPSAVPVRPTTSPENFFTTYEPEE